MINLIGCSRENFYKLLELMEYKRKKITDDKEEFFVYKPKFIKNNQKKNINNNVKDNPFEKLNEIRFR